MAILFTFPFIFVLILICTVSTQVSSKSIESERIITNIEDVYKGVPVDFGYNESSSGAPLPEYGMWSVPGCPRSVDGLPWVYYGSPIKCYLAGEVGPCDQHQKLFVQQGSEFGFCNCDCFDDITQTNGGNETQFCTSGPNNREYAFVASDKKCFALYDQGPCESNQWLVKSNGTNNNNETLCETRKCPSGQIPGIVYHEETQNQTSSVSEKISCFSPIAAFASPASIQPIDCESADMKFSQLLRKCIKTFSADSSIG